MLSNVDIDVLGPFEELGLHEAPRYLKINVIGTAVVFPVFLFPIDDNQGGELIALLFALRDGILMRHMDIRG